MRAHGVAYAKAVAHASKHGHSAVSGILIGTHTDGEVEIVDVLPMMHTHTTLAMLPQIALAQVTGREKTLNRMKGMNKNENMHMHMNMNMNMNESKSYVSNNNYTLRSNMFAHNAHKGLVP